MGSKRVYKETLKCWWISYPKQPFCFCKGKQYGNYNWRSTQESKSKWNHQPGPKEGDAYLTFFVVSLAIFRPRCYKIFNILMKCCHYFYYHRYRNSNAYNFTLHLFHIYFLVNTKNIITIMFKLKTKKIILLII